MQQAIEQALNQFESLCEIWDGGYGTMRKRAAFAYVWEPPTPRAPQSKSIDLTLQAITHGNEVGGILALIECLKLLHSGLLRPQLSLAFILGNPAAAMENRRFLEADLNRSFGAKSDTSLEAQRAAQLAKVLAETRYLLDFHQTIEACVHPFFIFPYTAAGFALARSSHSAIPIVTHWGRSFSLDGMCTDEFVNYSGGTGITIELGRKGFDLQQTSVGLHALLGVMRSIEGQGRGREESDASILYTWKQIVLYEEGMELREGLYNFQPVTRGEVLGVWGSKPLTCPEDGWLLFPKYARDPRAPRAKEIYRIAKRIEAHELGQPGVVGV